MSCLTLPLEQLLFPRTAGDTGGSFPQPDWSYMHAELRRKGVTLALLWEEYRGVHPDGYAYSRYCELYTRWEGKLSPVMRQRHPAGERLFVDMRRRLEVRNYRTNAHSKHDLKVHLIWIPKYRKRALTGLVAERTRDLLRHICMEHEVQVISGKVACDHVHMFVSYRPQLAVSHLVQYLKGSSSRVLLQDFPHLRKRFWGRDLWARGYMAISSGNITDKVVQRYIEDQEAEPAPRRSG